MLDKIWNDKVLRMALFEVGSACDPFDLTRSRESLSNEVTHLYCDALLLAHADRVLSLTMFTDLSRVRK